MRELRRETEIEAPPERVWAVLVDVQSERFSGLLVGLGNATLAKTETGFEQMNAALKIRAESASA